MKYSQFIQFDQLLEFNNTNLNTWLINFTNLNEAEGDPTDTLDTKKGNILTKKGRLRNSLNGHAKKLMDSINKEVADKFLKPIYDLKVQVYKKMAELGKGKQPKDIVTALKGDLQNIQKIQAKQLAQIEKYAQTGIDNYTKKIETTIQKKGLKESTKVDLQTYWSLLSTQIIMNLLQKIAIQDDKLINDTIKDPAIIKSAKIINKAVNKDLNSKTEELKKKSDEKKTAIKASDEKSTTEEKSSEEVKSE
jgi:hypothetical protein